MPAAQQQLAYFAGDPCPCDACRLRHRCAVERLACAAWSQYFYAAEWRHAPRAPSRAIYEATLGENPHRPLGRPRKRATV
jgi:hypothetical protein